MERRQRAEAFARLLKGTQSEPPDFHLANERSRRAEIDWDASTLVVQLLSRALPAPGRAAATSMFEHRPNASELANTFASLKEKLLIVEVFGRTTLANAAWRIARAQDAVSVSTSEVEMLRELAELPQPARRISRVDVDSILRSHSTTYPLTPDLMALVGLGVLRPDGPDGFFIALEGEMLGWRETTLRAAAILWERGPRGNLSGVAWLREWIDRVAMLDWSDAPRAMTHSGRSHFLDAAMTVILHEPTLRCNWQCEQLRLRMEEDEEYRSSPNEDHWSEPSSPLWRYRRYGKMFRSPRNAHRGLEEIVGLISAVVRCDSGANDVDEPGKRIVELLRAGSDRPFLSYWVPWLLHSRPAGIAWCLLHDDLAALGCGLILELQMAEESIWAAGIERIQREMEQRVSLWELGMRVLFSEVTHERVPGLASTIAEVLQLAIEASMSRRLLDSGHAAEEQRGLESILDRTLFAIREAKCGQVLSPGAGLASFRSKLLPQIARPVFVRLDQTQTHERGSSLRFPLATMRLLARWLEVTEEAALAAVGEGDIPASHEIATAVMTRYCSEFDRELGVDEGGLASVIHVLDEPALPSLPWGSIALALAGSDRLNSLLRPVDFRTRIREIPTRAARVVARNRLDDPQADLASAWANKLRLHLRTLLAVHAQLWQIRAPLELLEAIEHEILEILLNQRQDDVTAGTLQVFKRLGVFGMDVDGLAVAAAEELNRFSDSLRTTSYLSWIDTIQDVGLLLAALPSILPVVARTRASHRLAGFAKRDFLRSEYLIPHVQKLAEDAVVAHEDDLAERILAFGNANVRDGLRPDWAEFEYRTHAAIAFARNDRAAFDALVIPDSQGNRERAHRIASTTRFYDALFLLDTDPAAAAESFALQDPQHSQIVASNLLAARLRAATKLTIEHEQRAAFQRALDEWQRNSGAPLASPLSVRAAAQVNVLIALDGARHDDAFDVTWAGMTNEIRLQPESLRVFVANAQRRGKTAATKTAIDAALAYHRDSKGIAPDWLTDLSAQIVSETLLATPAALASTVRHRPTLPDLRESFLQMMRLPAPYLIRAVCDTLPLSSEAELLDDTELLGEYLLSQHIEAARALTDRKEAVRQINDENKYNDLFVSLLRARLAFLGWHVSDQSRGGKSRTDGRGGSSAGVGERDWAIHDRSGQLAITEAYRLDSVDQRTIREHLGKLEGYNPIGTNPTFVVVYVETDNFIAFAQRYQSFIESSVQPNGPTGVVAEYQCTLQPAPGAAIKTLRVTCTTPRGRNIVFHVLVHLGAP